MLVILNCCLVRNTLSGLLVIFLIHSLTFTDARDTLKSVTAGTAGLQARYQAPHQIAGFVFGLHTSGGGEALGAAAQSTLCVVTAQPTASAILLPLFSQ